MDQSFRRAVVLALVFLAFCLASRLVHAQSFPGASVTPGRTNPTQTTGGSLKIAANIGSITPACNAGAVPMQALYVLNQQIEWAICFPAQGITAWQDNGPADANAVANTNGASGNLTAPTTIVTTGASPVVMTLPTCAASSTFAQSFTVVRSDNTNTLTIATTGGQTINGAATYAVPSFGAVTLVCNSSSTAWFLAGPDLTNAAGVLTVPHGGTGLATLTNHALQVGATTSTPTQLAVGATGQYLAGATGADPVWATTPTGEINFSAYNAGNLGAGVAISRTKFTNAATLTVDSAITVDIAGVGTGPLVAKLCSDGVTCGAGNIYLTCAISGADCTTTAGTVTACTVTKAAVSAGTTLTFSVTTSCGVTDSFFNVNAHATVP